MNYLKCLFYNFLTVFFTNQFLPGIEIVNHTKLPHLGGDLLFALGLGLVNSLIFPVMKVVDQQISVVRIAIVSICISFTAYLILKFVSIIGLEIKTLSAFLIPVVVVGISGFVTNYLEYRRHHNIPRPPEMPHIS